MEYRLARMIKKLQFFLQKVGSTYLEVIEFNVEQSNLFLLIELKPLALPSNFLSGNLLYLG